MIISKLKSQYMTVPNILSFIRILIIIPFVYMFLNDNYILAALFLIVSGLSDMFDGIIARKLNQITALGKILDPIADKLTLVAVVICMGIKFPEIMPLVVLLLIKDVSMLLAGGFLIKKKIEPPAAMWYGKLSTILFYLSVIIIVFLKAAFGVINSNLSIFLLSITAVFMIFALIKYFELFVELLKKDKYLKKDIDKKNFKVKE